MIDRITLDGSNTESKLSVTVKKNKNGGDGIVTIGDVTVTGSLRGCERSRNAPSSVFVMLMLLL